MSISQKAAQWVRHPTARFVIRCAVMCVLEQSGRRPVSAPCCPEQR